MTLEVEPTDDSPHEDPPSRQGEDDAELNREFVRQSRIQADDDSCRSQSTSYDEDHTSPTEFQSTNASFKNRSKTKRNSKFPFKQCCKMMTSARRTLHLVDMSIIPKERFFKNPHYLMNCASCSSSSLTRTPRRDGSISFNPFDKRASTASGGNKFKLEDSKRRSSNNGLLRKLKMLTAESSNEASSHVTSPVLEDSATDTSASNGSVGHNGGSMLKSGTQKRRSQDGKMSTTSQRKEYKNTQQSRRASEDRGVHSQQGFTAFVPFQGFAAFANQRDRSDQTTPLSVRS